MTKQAYSKSKGREAENAVVTFLRSKGIAAERRRLAGVLDMGDVAGWGGIVVEIKAEKVMDLAGCMDELGAEVVNANKRLGLGHHGLAICKRKGTGDDVTRWYAVLTPELAVAALKALLEKSNGQ